METPSPAPHLLPDSFSSPKTPVIRILTVNHNHKEADAAFNPGLEQSFIFVARLSCLIQLFVRKCVVKLEYSQYLTTFLPLVDNTLLDCF